MDLWKAAADEFCEAVREKTVVIHKAFWAKKFRDHDSGRILDFSADKIAIAEKNNALLEEYYVYLQNNLAKLDIIEVDSDLVYSDYAHKWGVDYFHYGNEYYQAFSSQLLSILK